VEVTLGIDLASQPAGTAACRLRWSDEGAEAETLLAGLDDHALLALRDGASTVAIDAPFGFPRAFSVALGAWAGGGGWPAATVRELRFRATDLDVQRHTGLWPLSPSSDRIAIVAWRCATLLSSWGVADRVGGDGVLETYPAAALTSWGLRGRGYKSRSRAGAESAAAQRALLVDELLSACPWLRLSAEQRASCEREHDLLDALICALVARAALLGATRPPVGEQAAVAAEEGWIHLPTASTSALVGS
jgi:predicted nuclease with RNAse H fold